MKKPFLIYLSVILFLTTQYAWAYTPEDCMKCHREGSAESTLHLSIEQFEASIHAREMITCLDCHTGVKDEEHQEIKGSGAVDCGECHEQENRHASQTQGKDRPQCHSCHSRHGILEKGNLSSSVNPKRLRETCKGCHAAQCGETDYLSWFPSLKVNSHNKQDFSQAYERSNCIGCHQGMAVHGEEGQVDGQDCFKCHLSKEEQATLWGSIHPRADSKTQPGIFAAAVVYQAFFLALFCGGLWFCVGRYSRRKTRSDE